MNLSSEPQKAGCAFADIDTLVDALREFDVSVEGLMGVGPSDDDQATAQGFANCEPQSIDLGSVSVRWDDRRSRTGDWRGINDGSRRHRPLWTAPMNPPHTDPVGSVVSTDAQPWGDDKCHLENHNDLARTRP